MKKQKHPRNFPVVDNRSKELISKIAKRGNLISPDSRSVSEFSMDIYAVLAHQPMDLESWLKANDFNFAHDIFGIQRHLNRDTWKLEDCFLPRFSI